MIPRNDAGGPGQQPYPGMPPMPDAPAAGMLSKVVDPEAGAGVPEHRGRASGGRVDWAAVPRVNLLPQEIIDERRFRRVQRVLAGVVLLVVVLAGLATLWAQAGVASARAELAVTQAEAADLQHQQSRYAEVPKVSGELDSAKAAREQALGADVLWYRFLTDLAVNTPDGTALSAVTISMTGATTTGAVAEPLTPAGLGTVKISGQAGRFVDVAAWLDAAARVNGLGGTRLQTATRADGSGGAGRITYSGSAVILPAALSHRYDRKAD